MAELLIANGWDIADSLGKPLREALTGEYIVVCEPVVQGYALDAVVVGPDGLTVLHTRDWEGEVLPSPHRPWRERLASGEVVNHDNPGAEARQVAELLARFVRDEFPTLRPVIRQYVVLMQPTVTLATVGDTEPPCVRLDELVSVLARPAGADADATSGAAMSGAVWADAATRDLVAVALRDRQITASQRASQPFIFRSSGFTGTGQKAWTIREVVEYMDRRPDDGIHHLRNGTLEQWLMEQGALHLAQLAREATHQTESNSRVMLETFLLGTGLLPRPRAVIRPRTLDMGYVLTGETARRRLRIHRGRGRGYLYGSMQPSEPWIRIEPGTFQDTLEAVVSVDSEPLLIREQPSRAEIVIRTNATEEPVVVSIVANVVSMPPAASRYVARPLAGLLLAGALGALLGLALGRWGIPAPAWLTGAGQSVMSSSAAWALLIGVFWAITGGIRGAVQPPAWPIGYAAGRWLLRTAMWGAVVGGVAAGLTAFVSWLYPEAGEFLTGGWSASITLFGVALVALPGTVGEMMAPRPTQSEGLPATGALRRAMGGMIAVAVVFVALAGVRLVGPTWVQYDFDSRAETVQEWVGQRWGDLERGVNDVVDRIYLRWYDRPERRGGRLPWQ